MRCALQTDYRLNRLSLALLFLCLAVCAWIVWSYWPHLALLAQISPAYAAILFFLFGLVQLVNGYRVFLLVRFFGARVRLWDWIGLPYLTAYLNYLPVNAGTGTTALFLKRRYALPITKFISLSGTSLMLHLFCFSTAGLLLTAWMGIRDGRLNHYALGGFLLILLVVLGFRLLPLKFLKGQSRLGKWAESVLTGLYDLRRDRRLMTSLILNSYLQLALMGLGMYVTFLSLGLSVSYLEGLLLGIVTSVSKYHFLFPGLLGIRELFIATASKAVQGSFGNGVAVAVADRVITGLATILLGNLFLVRLLRK